MRRLNVRIVALALVLVFTQKMGLRLWMHHWLHETRAISASKNTVVDKLQPNCDCIDDFLMPVTGSDLVELPPPVRQVHAVITAAYIPPFSAAEQRLSSPRGPPAYA
jgi:hypothetical protein